MKSLTIFCLSLLAVSGPLAGATYNVDANRGKDTASGQSADAAFATLQRACDAVHAGDTVLVAPGIYFETPQLHGAGTADAPITFKTAAVKEGSVIVTAANPDLRRGKTPWELVDAPLALYRVPFDHKPSRMLYDGVDLLPYPDVASLRAFRFSNGYPGTEHGFAFEGGQLYVRLHPGGVYGSPDPGKHVMAVAPPGGLGGGAAMTFTRPGDANFAVLAPSAFVVLDGFTFETPGGAGVFVAGGDVTVRNCYFRGCRSGVAGPKLSPKPEDRTRRVTIEYCDFSQFPAFDDMREVILHHRDDPWRTNADPKDIHKTIYWWQRKGSFAFGGGSQETYEIGIGANIGDDWTVRYNRIHDAFEGLSVWATAWSVNLHMYGNRIERCVDNAIEAEDHAANLHFEDNEVVDVFEPFSWQPLGGLPWPGPIYFCHNLVWYTPASENLWAQAGWTPGIWKLGAEEGNWKRADLKLAPDTPVRAGGEGFFSFNNTVCAPDHNAVTRVQSRDRRYEQFTICNNLVVLKDISRSAVVDQGIVFARNAGLFVGPADRAAASKFFAEGGVEAPTREAVGWRDAAKGNFTVGGDGPAAQVARQGGEPLHPKAQPQAGALAPGAGWKMPPYGPQEGASRTP